MDSALKWNVFWKALEAVVTIAASFIQLSCIAHSYEPAIVGQFQLTLAWLFVVSALSCCGAIIMVSTRELSNRVESERHAIFSASIVLQAMIASPLAIASIWIFHSSAHFQEIALPLSVGTLALLGSATLQQSQALLMSRDQVGKVVSASILGHLVATTAVIFSAYQGASVATLIGAWAVCNVIHGSVLLLQSRGWRLISVNLVTIEELKWFVREILPILVMTIATSLYVRIDVIMLDYFTNKEVVAQYSAGYIFLDQLMILSNFMMGALFPNFARSCLVRGKDYQILYHGILRLFLKYLVPIALLIAIFPQFLLETFYGPEYAVTWKSLMVLMIAAIFAWINCPSGIIFISLNKQHLYMWATLLSVVINVVGNLILIPGMGAVGAAVSTVVTEAAICSYCLWWIWRETGYLPWRTPAR